MTRFDLSARRQGSGCRLKQFLPGDPGRKEVDIFCQIVNQAV
jgi:hypothetical protein